MKPLAFGACLFGLFLSACSPSAHTHDHPHAHRGSTNTYGYSAAAMASAPETVDCLLETGQPSHCLKLVVKHKPSDLGIGPFCPETLEDAGGIWSWDGEQPGLYRVNGDFFRMIAAEGYLMFDGEGTVIISDISVAPPADAHSCIQVSEDTSVTITALIPLEPAMAERPTRLGVVNKVGMALTGTPIFSDAPSVHHTGHMPALDQCGGHVDPGGWYHWHANSNDIATVFEAENVDAACALVQDGAQLFGYAFDGFPIYGSLELDGSLPQDLDDCRGHIGEMTNGEIGYHYHTGEDFPNLPRCLNGIQAMDNFSTTAQVGVGANPPPGTEITRRDPPGGGRGPRGGPPDLSDAAQQLGIPEQELSRILRESGRPPNLTIAAEQLNVSEADLRAALPARRRP